MSDTTTQEATMDAVINLLPLQEAVTQIYMLANIPVMKWGMDGEGKSEYDRALCRAWNWGCGVLIGSQCDPTDIGGMPVIQTDGGHFIRVPHRIFREAMEHGERGVPYLIVYDEANAAPTLVQAAEQNTLTAREAGDVKLPDTTRFALSANPSNIGVGTTPYKPPMLTRMAHVDWALDIDTWATGMLGDWPTPRNVTAPKGWEKNILGQRAIAVAFIKANRGLFRQEPREAETDRPRATPRCWTNLCRALAMAESLGANDDVMNLLVRGIVGIGAARSFNEFRVLRNLVDIEDAFKNPKTCTLPPMDRPDIQWIFFNSVAAEVVQRKTLKDWKAGWEILLRYEECGAGKDMIVNGAHAIATLASEIKGAGKNIPKGILELLPMLKALATL